ncbi:MAG: folate-binding protein YgfZ [Gammaproteobacteria bacterium]
MTDEAPGAKARLSALGVLRISGADARDFLHGQFTANLQRLAPGHGGVAAWCSPKGRVLFLLELLNVGDEGWLLLAPASELPALVKRLRMYVLRAKVLVEDASAHWRVIGLAGSAVPASLAAIGAAERAGEAWLWRIGADPALAYALGPQDAVAALWDGIDAPVIDEARWEAFEIEALRPRIVAPLAERFLPQELDLERLQGLHFDKGCYPGQEVIARLKYRGQLKSGLHRARSDGPAAVGDKIYRDGASARVGEVLRVAPHADGTCTLLTVLDFDATDAPLRLRDAQGPRVTPDV